MNETLTRSMSYSAVPYLCILYILIMLGSITLASSPLRIIGKLYQTITEGDSSGTRREFWKTAKLLSLKSYPLRYPVGCSFNTVHRRRISHPKKEIIVEIPDNSVQTVTNTFHINTTRRKKSQGEMFQTFFWVFSLFLWSRGIFTQAKVSIVREWRNIRIGRSGENITTTKYGAVTVFFVFGTQNETK